ncbi:hypothetical protein [Helicobacter gastrocanis]|uniref:hypothetical protein n=1 Tax=Helicobacter gastrocanis TaxID=2849641 RepID=UPI001C8667B3|nr:hypothetical protein [Helicobacter sp. NHP19-003]
MDQNLQDYFRVVRHLVENFIFQLGKIPGVLKILDFVSNAFSSQHPENGVYAFLAKDSKEFEAYQYQLEARKAKLILKSRESKEFKDWEEALQRTSEHRYLVGYVGFLLDFSKEGGEENLQKFQAYAKHTIDILDTFFLNDNDLGVLQRAWLCFGDYSIEEENKFFGNRHQVGEFRYRNPVFKLFAKKINGAGETYFFCKLLDRLLGTSKADLVEKMHSIIAAYTFQREQLIKRSWWEQCLLQEEKLFAYMNAKQSKKCGRIKIEGGGAGLSLAG